MIKNIIICKNLGRLLSGVVLFMRGWPLRERRGFGTGGCRDRCTFNPICVPTFSHTQFAAKDFRRALQGFERHAGIVGIEQAVELRAAIIGVAGKLPIAVRGPAC